MYFKPIFLEETMRKIVLQSEDDPVLAREDVGQLENVVLINKKVKEVSFLPELMKLIQPLILLAVFFTLCGFQFFCQGYTFFHCILLLPLLFSSTLFSMLLSVIVLSFMVLFSMEAIFHTTEIKRYCAVSTSHPWENPKKRCSGAHNLLKSL